MQGAVCIPWPGHGQMLQRFNRCFDLPATLPGLLQALVKPGALALKVLRLSEVSS